MDEDRRTDKFYYEILDCNIIKETSIRVEDTRGEETVKVDRLEVRVY